MDQKLRRPEDLPASLVAAAKRALETEHVGLQQLIDALDGPLGTAFLNAFELIRRTRGRVILSGIGKSGHIARKIAATLASTGTPALFVHAAETSHGDLGMITRDDVLLVLSTSGETADLRNLLRYAQRFEIPLIAMTTREQSMLALAANVVLPIPAAAEACPIGLAPTTSTTLQLALGDALAISLLEDKGFSAVQFRDFHPGGKLGASLTYVHEIMHSGERMPLCDVDTLMSQCLLTMTEKSFGCLGILAADGSLCGLITDGDLRRHMRPNLLSLPASAIMT
ncbi:MAG: KpsF/GutQ family sugar-phosphate isomerase, partial [Aestuariivirgaceae bacterium]